MPETTKAPRGFRSEPFSYHEIVDLEITTLTNQGHGLGRLDNWVILVAFALPGELVRVRIFKNHPKYSEADLVEILRASPDRVEPRCSLFTQCGGCQYQNLRYEKQLDWKRRQVEELLRHMAAIEFPVSEVVPSARDFHYRSKITPHFRKPRAARTRDDDEAGIREIGFLRAASRHRIVDVPECPIASESINAALAGLRDEVRENAARYRRGATLLLRDSEDGVLTDSRAVAVETAGGLKFQFAAGDFFQNNPHILEAFTEYVGEQAALAGARFLVDAYCGSGLFCLTAAHRFEHAAGIEINESAIKWALKNAACNGVTNASFHCGVADSIFGEIDFAAEETAVIIDPPRKGCDREFLDQLFSFRPQTVVYVSCNPATQMRDLAAFLEGGAYELFAVQPFDLFPQTKHLECVMTLRRR